MRNICMTVSYDGTDYNGFQTQPDSNTIQDHIERAIAMLTGEVLKITASGRTDAGVHARGQVFNFYTASRIPVNRWCLALNSRLPDDIVVMDAREVSESFHSRRSAKQKTYHYVIRSGKYRDLFRRRTEYHHPTALNVGAMKEALGYLQGEHDFTSFCSTKSTKVSNVRTILRAELSVEEHLIGGEPSTSITIAITGTGFLYNMVRIIVGTLLQIGENKRSSADMQTILLAKNRAAAGPTAVPHGLILWEVLYPESI